MRGLSLLKRKRKITALFIFSALLIITFSAAAQINGVSAKMRHNHEVTVLLFTNANSTDYRDPDHSAVYTALSLDPRIHVIPYRQLDDVPGKIRNTSVYNFSKIDVIFLENFFPQNKSDQEYILQQVSGPNNIGLIFMGGYYPSNVSLSLLDAFIPAYFITPIDAINNVMENPLDNIPGFNNTPTSYVHDYVIYNTTESTFVDDDIQVAISDEESAKPEDEQTPFSRYIAWQSCPLLHERFSTFAKKPGAYTLVEVPNTLEPLIVYSTLKNLQPNVQSNGSILYISPGTGYYVDEEGNQHLMNQPFSLWPYFNYLMYLSVYYLDYDFDRSLIEDYADWPYSPIPHEKEAALWMIFVASLWVFNFALFFSLGKKKGERDIRELKREVKEEQIEALKNYIKNDQLKVDILAEITELDKEQLLEKLQQNQGKKKLSGITIEGDIITFTPNEDKEQTLDTLLDNLFAFIMDNFEEWAQEELIIKQNEREIRIRKRENLESMFKASKWVSLDYIAEIFGYDTEVLKGLLQEAIETNYISGLEIKGSFVLNNEERETRTLLNIQKIIEIVERGEVPKVEESSEEQDTEGKEEQQEESQSEEKDEAQGSKEPNE